MVDLSAKPSLSKAATMFWASIIARAWEDDKFKDDLMNDPKGELNKLGFPTFKDATGDEVKIKVEKAQTGKSCEYETKTKTLTFYLPEKPDCAPLIFNGQFTAGFCS